MPGGIAGIRGSQKIIDNATQVVEIFRTLDPEETDPEERAKVRLLQYKNTMSGQNGVADIYFDMGTYVEECPPWITAARQRRQPASKPTKKEEKLIEEKEETDMPWDK